MISVIIPSKNRSNLARRAISSLRFQGVDDCQVVVINDGSTESYEKVKNLLYVEDVYIENVESVGVSQARNQGIEQAKHDWILFLDDDDELRPGYIRVLIDSIRINSKVDFFWSDVIIYMSNGSTTISRINRNWPKKYWNQDHLYSTALSIGASFGLAARRSKLLEVGLFDRCLPVGEDMDLMIRLLASKAKPKSIPFYGVNKFENRMDRLSSGFRRYSSEKIFEKIFFKNSIFFDNHPYCKGNLIFFAACIHAKYGDFESEKLLLDDLLLIRQYRLFLKYRFMRFIRGGGFLVNDLT